MSNMLKLFRGSRVHSAVAKRDCDAVCIVNKVLNVQKRAFSTVETDKYRLYLVTDDKYLDDKLEKKILEACRGGVSMVQLRLKQQNTAIYLKTARSLRSSLKKEFPGVPFFIDDRLDVALGSDADGLHIGNGDMDVKTARKLLGASKLLGVSTYGNHETMLQAKVDGADYVAGGGIASSLTKDFVPKGFIHLHEFKKAAGETPVVAIGGIGMGNAYDTIYAGADGIACVSSLLDFDVSEIQGQAKALRGIVDKAIKEKAKGKSDTLADSVERVRSANPLVQCITNYVSMDIMANVFLASGCSPAMAHAIGETEDFATIASVVSINVGHCEADWNESMRVTADKAKELDKPWVLDPIAAGATKWRTDLCVELTQKKPTVIRGNPSEILACAKGVGIEVNETADGQKGVDSALDSLSVDLNAVDNLAKYIGGVVVMTGRNDYITDGRENRFVACHDVPGLQLITAAGCSLSSLVGAFVSVARGPEEYAQLSADACAYYTLAAQMARKDILATQNRSTNIGSTNTFLPGTLRVGHIDWLNRIDSATLSALGRIERL